MTLVHILEKKMRHKSVERDHDEMQFEFTEDT